MKDKTTVQAVNTIVLGDCIAGLNGLAEGSVDLAFADPPFNIGYDYDVYDDGWTTSEYLDWSRRMDLRGAIACLSRRARSGWRSATNMPPS